VFTSTIGSGPDLENEGVRRLLVNASYWCLGMEEELPDRADVRLVGEYKPKFFSFGGHKKGMCPSDHRL
jgi:hypothetical protein